MPRNTTKATSTPKYEKYENNPFFIAANGISSLFNLAVGVAIFLVVLSIFSFLVNNLNPGENVANNLESYMNAWSSGQWALALVAILIIGLAVSMIYALFGGVSSYASYKLSQGERVNLNDAFRISFDKLWSYLWLQIIIVVKIFLWSLLLFIPGIIMAFRYTLAGVAFFDEDKNLRGDAAIKESLRLTKGAWITTFASNMLFNFLTFGFFSPVITTAVNAVLYKQYSDLKDNPKPAAHWLSWATLAVPFALLVLGLVLLLGLFMGFVIAGSH